LVKTQEAKGIVLDSECRQHNEEVVPLKTSCRRGEGVPPAQKTWMKKVLKKKSRRGRIDVDSIATHFGMESHSRPRWRDQKPWGNGKGGKVTTD